MEFEYRRDALSGRGITAKVGGIYAKTPITIHSTGNPKSTAQNERGWLDNPTNNREAWHCGNASGNKLDMTLDMVRV